METEEKQKLLKLTFENAYREWIITTGWQTREFKWIEYCTARDAYLGLSYGYFEWQNLKLKNEAL